MRRVLGIWDLLVIAAAAIGPAFSLATTMGPMVGAAGYAAPLTLVFVTLVMACVAIGYSRLGARFPNAGSSYSWIRTAFGAAFGAYGAWVLIVANIFAIVVTAIPAGSYTLDLIAPQLADSPQATGIVGALWTIAAGALLARGLKPTTLVAAAFVVAEFAVLGAAALAASFVHAPAQPVVAATNVHGLSGLVGAVVIGIWMLDGWEVSASTAEESTDVNRAPGLGGLGGLALTAAILVIGMTAFLRIGTPAGFADHPADVMAYVGSLLGGGAWRWILTVTVLASLAASLQTTLVYLSRSLFAMGRDGLVPAALGRLDRRGVPMVAVVGLTGLGVLFCLASGLFPSVKAGFDLILSGTSVFLGLLFLLSAAASVRIFWTERGARWLSGAGIPGIASVALAGILVAAVNRSDRPTQAFLVASAVLGLPFALWRGRAATTQI